MDDVCALAVTGSDPAPGILIAMGLFALGALVLLTTVRRARRVAAVVIVGLVLAGALFAPAPSASAADCSTVPLVTVADAATVVEDAVPATAVGDVVANDTGARGRTITVVDPGTSLTEFGSIDLARSGAFVYTLDNADAAVDELNAGESLDDTISYRVTDGSSTKTGSLTVTITGTTDNSLPVATADAASVTEDGASVVASTVLANDSDPDGDPLTVSNPGVYTLQYGLLSINSNGTYTYALDNANPAVDALNDRQSLTDVFTYSISDGHGGSASITLTVTINGHSDNRAPVAFADTNAVTEDAAPASVSGNVLTNDSDPDGNTLTVANAGTVTLAYGSLVINASGAYLYTLDNANPAVNSLNDGQSLTDTFSYTVSDGHGGSATSTLTISINGTTDPAHLTAVADTASIKEDAVPNTVSGNLLSKDSDAAGHTLAVTSSGTFALSLGSLVINANGSFTYTLDNSRPLVNSLNTGQSLTDGFIYSVSDGNGNNSTAAVTITVNGTTDNRPPTVDVDTNSVKEDAAPNTVTGNVLGNDSDPDGNTLTVANAGTFTLLYGTLVIHADGSYSFSLDNSDPVVNALDDGQNVTNTFTYTVSDGHGATSSSTLTITVNGTTDG